MAQVSSLDRLGRQSVRPGRGGFPRPTGKRRAAIWAASDPADTLWCARDARAYEGPERYGFADRGSVSIHLTEWAEHDPFRTAASVYLCVSDADAVYAERKALEHLEGRLIAPHDTPYGLREFVYVDPDGTAHRVGSPRD